ncbi:MAG: hypothetical protein H7A39_05430 [Chlamydiales bacterium]|nr:hypothetical protein [Chlamydiales bacterium]
MTNKLIAAMYVSTHYQYLNPACPCQSYGQDAKGRKYYKNRESDIIVGIRILRKPNMPIPVRVDNKTLKYRDIVKKVEKLNLTSLTPTERFLCGKTLLTLTCWNAQEEANNPLQKAKNITGKSQAYRERAMKLIDKLQDIENISPARDLTSSSSSVENVSSD